MDVKRVITVDEKIKIIKLKVKKGTMVYDGRILLIYEPITEENDLQSEKQKQKKLLKSTEAGIIRKIFVKENQIILPGSEIIQLEKECNHPTVIRDLCAECGADLQKETEKEGVPTSQASVSMIHMVPELKVNPELAQILGKAEMDRLLEEEKLVLLVDLDQTLIHTTNDIIPNNIKDVYHFQLYGRGSLWYHTRLRPGTHNFLRGISEKYELHICTFGSRRYAHTIAQFLDPDGNIFSHRILSRDECFDANSKTANLKALFPSGENMVCIIDDREDVWDYASNLIHVKPYHFFQHTGDIHAPPGLTKCENDDNKQGFDFTQLEKSSSNTPENLNEEGDDSTKNDALEKTEGKKAEYAEESDKGKDSGDKEKTEEHLASEVMQSEEVSSCDTEKTVENKYSNQSETDRNNENFNVNAQTFDDTVAQSLSNPSEEMEIDEQKDNTVVHTEETELEKSVATISAQNTNDFSENIEVDKSDSNITSHNAGNLTEENESKEFNENTSLKNADGCTNENDSTQTTEIEPKDVPTSLFPKLDSDGLIIIEEADDYLLYLEEILKVIHCKFFKCYRETGEIPDLKQVIPETRATVLRNVKIVFSGIVPNHKQLERSPAYKIARSLGAVVTQNIEPDTTHLVALRAGTAKVHAASRRKNLKLVTPEWLWTCAERWEKVDERLFPLQDSKMNTESRNPPAHCHSPDRVDTSPPPAPQVHNRVVQPSQDNGFLFSINPLMSLSSEDIQSMEGEVEDMFKESDDENETDKETLDTTEQRENVNTGKKRKKEDEKSSSSSSDFHEDDGDVYGMTKKVRKKRRRVEYEDEYSNLCVSNIENETEECDDEDDNENEQNTDDETINDKFRRGEGLPSDLDIDYNSEEGSEDDQGSDGEWNVMGAALEREFLED